jgi:hypothetical protein|tara:strand:+ start:3022 stop:3528 length:507 start_codon:yes stop_codon:yes gene_type:complete
MKQHNVDSTRAEADSRGVHNTLGVGQAAINRRRWEAASHFGIENINIQGAPDGDYALFDYSADYTGLNCDFGDDSKPNDGDGVVYDKLGPALPPSEERIEPSLTSLPEVLPVAWSSKTKVKVREGCIDFGLLQKAITEVKYGSLYHGRFVEGVTFDAEQNCLVSHIGS